MNSKITNIFAKACIIFACTAVILPVTLSLLINTSNSKVAQAAPAYICNNGETLSGTDCVIPVNNSPTYATQCPAGFTEAFSVCVQRTAKACSTFNKAEVDPLDSTLCRFVSTLTGSGTAAGLNPLIAEVDDIDGRYCRSAGSYNIKMYKVAIGTALPPQVQICGNTYSSVGGPSVFRFEPFEITTVGNYVTVQTGTTNSPCPSNYTIFNSNTQCRRPALVNSCSAVGEYFATNSTCTPCPAGKYCPIPNLNITGGYLACVNGGTLNTAQTQCTANNKITTTSHTDGCVLPMIKMDKTCVIPETRLVDTGCTYFYASADENLKAIQANDPATRTQDAVTYQMCSTGGSTTFNSTDIVQVSSLECLGAGSAWYNYNIRLDPLVCGIGNPADKVNFRWTATTFTKITPLNKIPANTLVCPVGWTELDATTCYQAPVAVSYTAPTDCPVNTYSGAGAGSCTVCPVAGTSTTTGNTSATICGTQTPTQLVSISLPTQTKEIVSKTPCIATMGYYTDKDGDCMQCPEGMTTMKAGATSIEECYKPTTETKVVTVRTGGLNLKEILPLTFGLFTFFAAGFAVFKKQTSFQSEWIKLK